MAFRASAKYDYQPGWINVFGPEERTNNTAYGVPLLADPADPVNSSPIYTSRSDWNWQRSFTGRASLLWKPLEAFSAELALLHSEASGDGGPQVNPVYAGGVSPFDPRTVFPAGGPYQELALIDEPWDADDEPDESRSELRRGVCHGLRDELVPYDRRAL